MTRKKTHEEFMVDFNKMNKHAQDIELLESYISAHTKIKCKCKKCEQQWTTEPNTLLRGHGCPKCRDKMNAQKRTKTHEEFIQRLQQINPDIELLTPYNKIHTKIKCKCKIDGYEWKATPANLLRGAGCPQCAGLAKPTQEEFIAKVKQLNPDIEVLGTYKTNRTKIKCRCRIDGYVWEAVPKSLLRGTGCPECNISKGEKRIAQYLDNLGIDYIYNMCYFKDLVGTGGGLMRPDFIIPSMKIWIEYDGQQHSKPVNFKGAMSAKEVQQLFNYTQQNDQIKNQYAKDNNWTLIRIPFTEYDNIEQILAAYLKQEQVI